MVGSRQFAEPCRLWTTPGVESLDEAILCTLSYADIFDYPLTLAQLHRYLIGFRASPEDVAAAVRKTSGVITQNGYFAFAGRASLIPLRIRRERTALLMWSRALVYGSAIARLPFVRMVALTGALPMRNVSLGDDYDYLVVTAPGRVWLSRRLIILLIVRRGARCGETICPNYILSEDALTLRERDLFHAHELTQMVPLYGLSVYERLRQANSWADDFLPNAGGPPLDAPPQPLSRRLGQVIPELVLRTAAGSWLERREMERLRRKMKATGRHQEVDLSLDCCKGHTEAHGRGTFEVFSARLQARE